MWYRANSKQHRRYWSRVPAARFLIARSCDIFWYNSPIALLLWFRAPGDRTSRDHRVKLFDGSAGFEADAARDDPQPLRIDQTPSCRRSRLQFNTDRFERGARGWRSR